MNGSRYPDPGRVPTDQIATEGTEFTESFFEKRLPENSVISVPSVAMACGTLVKLEAVFDLLM
jgi:hypothetical protein